ncbi:MAG: type I pullulanase, partial [Planctomycetota bacterium]
MLVEVRLATPVADADVASMRLDMPDFPEATVHARGVLDDPRFSPLKAELGAACTRESTTFTTWSPVSHRVDLLLYGDDAKAAPREVPLKRGERGLWSATVPGDLHGTRYRFRFQSYGKDREVPDIHAVAATNDSAFSVVADLSREEPAGWRETGAPTVARQTDEVLYEVHVRDYSVADPACPAELRGTYLGLVQSHPAAGGAPSSGIDHLKDLGVTAVHLMPVHDFTAKPDEYTWGYWTALFNVPESNYASRKGDPLAPVRELRQAIEALHKAGIRVVLDVVYNHTSSNGEWSPFDQTVPFYYFRTAPDGSLLNDSGCGNAVADERPMVRKYIVDSLEHWLRDYRVDGFRFDLLGTHTPQTVREACDRLVALRPDITLYGEPWTGGGPTRFGKGAQKGLRIAVFNDHLRNAIRGDLDGTATGFATGPGGDREAVKRGVQGAIDDFAQEPGESVNYASAHDNLTLADKVTKAQPGAGDGVRRAMQKLALGMVLTSQGMPFLHGASDFACTKGGNHNSYDAGDQVNRFDWDRKAAYADVHDYAR